MLRSLADRQLPARLHRCVLAAQSVAEQAAKLVQVSYQRSHDLGKPVLTIDDAVRTNSFHDPPGA